MKTVYIEREQSYKPNSNGNIKISAFFNNSKITVQNNIGKISYGTGEINLTNFNPTLVNDGNSYIELKVTPRDFDVSPVRNQIITIDENSININMENISRQFLTQNNV